MFGGKRTTTKPTVYPREMIKKIKIIKGTPIEEKCTDYVNVDYNIVNIQSGKRYVIDQENDSEITKLYLPDIKMDEQRIIIINASIGKKMTIFIYAAENDTIEKKIIFEFTRFRSIELIPYVKKKMWLIKYLC